MRHMFGLAVAIAGVVTAGSSLAEAQSGYGYSYGYGSPGYYPRAYYSQGIYGYGADHYYYGRVEVPRRAYSHGRVYEYGDEVYVRSPRVNVYYGRNPWDHGRDLHIDVPYFRMHLRH